MNIVGFNFTKINAERKKAVVGRVQINNGIQFREVKAVKMGLGDRGAVAFGFTFKTDYQPDFATLTFDGEVLGLTEQAAADKIVAGWDKDKRIQPEVAQGVLNYLLDRCSVQALLVARDLGLPAPVQLPKVTMQPVAKVPEAGMKTTKVDKPKKK